MSMRIKGDWFDAGFMCDLAPRYVMIAVDENGIYDDELGYRLTLAEDGELSGWPCHTFMPDNDDLERLRGKLCATFSACS